MGATDRASAPRPPIWAYGSAPDPVLNRGRIVEAAIAIADDEGIDALSMRRLAGAMGVGTMSLYRHVPNKDDLLGLMNDALLGERELPAAPSDDWRADLRLVGRHRRAVALRHPWWIRIAIGRPPIGPNALRLSEFALSTLDRFGLDMTTMQALVNTVNAYVMGAVGEDLAEAEVIRRTGVSEEQWQQSLIPWAERLVADGRHPMTARFIADAEHWDDDRSFEFGLERVLDGVAAVLTVERPSSA